MNKNIQLLLWCVPLLVLSLSLNANARSQQENLKHFSDIYTKIQRHYVDRVSDDELVNQCIQGMMDGLDSYSEYLDEQALTDLSGPDPQRQAGIGVKLTLEGDAVRVISPLDDTPAAKAGIRPGDIIVSLDGQDVSGLALSRVIDMIKGRAGSKLALGIMRDSFTEPLNLDITRKKIRLESIKSRRLGGGLLYLRIAFFGKKTAAKIKSLLGRQKKKVFSGLILDLRNNPGGLLSSAVEISDLFLDTGRIAFTDGKGEAELDYRANPGDIIDNIPIAVLINEGTASSSEILAGALKENKRATVVGSRSLGKGSVQAVIRLTGGGALKLTTSRWRSANGNMIEGMGISPDLDVVNSSVGNHDQQLENAVRLLLGK